MNVVKLKSELETVENGCYGKDAKPTEKHHVLIIDSAKIAYATGRFCTFPARKRQYNGTRQSVYGLPGRIKAVFLVQAGPVECLSTASSVMLRLRNRRYCFCCS